MTSGANEVETRMYAHISLVGSIWLLFLSHMALMLIIDEIDDGRPRVFIIDIVAKTRSINDCELDFELLLLKFCLDDIYLGIFIFELLDVTPDVVFACSELRRE